MFTNPNEVAKPSIFLPSGGFKPADRRAASRFSLRLGRQKMCPVSCRCRCTWPQVTPRKPCRAVPGRSLWSLVTYGLWRLNQIQISQIREKMGKTKSECCESIMKVLRHKLPVPSSPGASMLIRAYRGSARFTASSLRCRCSASLPLQYWHSIDTVDTVLLPLGVTFQVFPSHRTGMEFFMSFRSCRWLKNVSALLQLQLHLDLHSRFGRCFPRRRGRTSVGTSTAASYFWSSVKRNWHIINYDMSLLVINIYIYNEYDIVI